MSLAFNVILSYLSLAEGCGVVKHLEPLSAMGVLAGVMRTGWGASCTIMEMNRCCVVQRRSSPNVRVSLCQIGTDYTSLGNGMTPSCVWWVSKEWQEKAHPHGPPKVSSVQIVMQNITCSRWLHQDGRWVDVGRFFPPSYMVAG